MTTLRFKRGDSTAAQSFTGADGELYINTTTKAVHIHDGVTAGGSSLATQSFAQAAFNQANTASSGSSAGSYANSAFLQANTATTNALAASTYANGAFIQANTAATNVTIIQGVDNTQNTNITTATSLAQNAYNAANAAITAAQDATYDQSIYNQANTATTNALAASTYANGAFIQANTAVSNAAAASSYANSAFAQANTALNNNVGINATQNTSISTLNTNVTTIQGVNDTQNTSIGLAWSTANAAFTAANSAGGGGSSSDSWARTQANSAYSKANSAGSYANSAFSAANSAYSTASTAYSYATQAATTSFPNITVGGTNVFSASSATDTLNFVAGSGISITGTNVGVKTLTISATGGGGGGGGGSGASAFAYTQASNQGNYFNASMPSGADGTKYVLLFAATQSPSYSVTSASGFSPLPIGPSASGLQPSWAGLFIGQPVGSTPVYFNGGYDFSGQSNADAWLLDSNSSGYYQTSTSWNTGGMTMQTMLNYDMNFYNNATSSSMIYGLISGNSSTWTDIQNFTAASGVTMYKDSTNSLLWFKIPYSVFHASGTMVNLGTIPNSSGFNYAYGQFFCLL